MRGQCKNKLFYKAREGMYICFEGVWEGGHFSPILYLLNILKILSPGASGMRDGREKRNPIDLLSKKTVFW
jgi:hypothetical protein